MGKEMVKFENVIFAYDENGKVIQIDSWKVQEKEFIAIVGTYGSGKTTLLKLINGSVQPAEGQIVIDGVTLTEATYGDIIQKVGFLHENPDDQLFLPTVIDDIGFSLMNFDVPSKEIYRRVISVTKKMDIVDLLERDISSLSFGERKLVALAGVLVINPKILILDDPLLGLDFWTSKQLLNLLQRLKRSTTIICTANQWEVLDLADRIVLMVDGKINLEFDSADAFRDYFNSTPNHQE